MKFQTHPNYNLRSWLVKEGESAGENRKTAEEQVSQHKTFEVDVFIEGVTIW
jgi:hypothetical protein